MRTRSKAGAPVVSFLLFAAFLLIAAGCGRKAERPVRSELSVKAVVVAPASVSPTSPGWSGWLARHMPDAQRFPPDRLAEAADHCVENDLVMVLPHAPGLRDSSEETLRHFLLRGGRLLILGEPIPVTTIHDDPDYNKERLMSAAYTTTSGSFRVSGNRLGISIAPRPLHCMYPEPLGSGGESAGHARWIPVVTAMTAGGETAGIPGSVLLQDQQTEKYSLRGWLGMDPLKDNGEMIEMVEAMLETMTREAYLIRFGTEYFSMRSQQSAHVSARVVDRRLKDATPVRLSVEWINRQGMEVRRHLSPPFETLAMPVTLNAGLAPDVLNQPELFTLRISIRDRNDQRTLDRVEQPIKIFPVTLPEPEKEPITVLSGRLTQGRTPIFMLGVNYWPRFGANLSANAKHWLDPAEFDPAGISADLDMLIAAGINALTLEYTDMAQAPQLLYVLDELRRRSIWTVLYVPALHPLDLRLDDGMRMLNAIRLNEWPEVFAIELARGLTVRIRSERRHLDLAWADWLDEHFNSPTEAEQKLGVSLWRDRGRLSGPPDRQIRNGPHADRAVALYFSFLRDYASRQMGHTRETLRNKSYNQLLTARSSYGWPTEKPADVLDTLDISVGVIHLDFMFPDAWHIHPLHVEKADGPRLYSYARGISGGKPVLWAEYGHHVGSHATPSSLQRQKEVYKYYLDMFIDQGASGAFAWWFPPGPPTRAEEDWGLVTPQGSWRPVEEIFRSSRLRLRQTRTRPANIIRQHATLIQSASQWRDQQKARQGFFAAAQDATTTTEWLPPGSGMESRSLLNPRGRQQWSEIDGLYMLNSEWGTITQAGAAQTRAPGDNVRTYTGRPLDLELINSGTVRWTWAADRQPGSIWLRMSQPGHADEWLAIAAINAGGRTKVRWTPREPGIWDVQPFMVGFGRFGERLRIEATSPPRPF